MVVALARAKEEVRALSMRDLGPDAPSLVMSFGSHPSF